MKMAFKLGRKYRQEPIGYEFDYEIGDEVMRYRKVKRSLLARIADNFMGPAGPQGAAGMPGPMGPMGMRGRDFSVDNLTDAELRLLKSMLNRVGEQD